MVHIHVYDFINNSGGLMYKIVIESPVFSEKSKLEQHKMVMDVICDDML